MSTVTDTTVLLLQYIHNKAYMTNCYLKFFLVQPLLISLFKPLLIICHFLL